MSSLAVPTDASKKDSSSDKGKEVDSYGKTTAPPIRAPASVPEITAVSGLVPVLQ
jgi:hypothetical protein